MLNEESSEQAAVSFLIPSFPHTLPPSSSHTLIHSLTLTLSHPLSSASSIGRHPSMPIRRGQASSPEGLSSSRDRNQSAQTSFRVCGFRAERRRRGTGSSPGRSAFLSHRCMLSTPSDNTFRSRKASCSRLSSASVPCPECHTTETPLALRDAAARFEA